jgi:DNA-binding NarL/FixJ family response regulator
MNHGSMADQVLSNVGAAETGQRRVRVVLADDHKELLDQIGQLLKDEFDIVCSVSEGRALVAAASEWRPDIIISDINMPHLTGPEATRRILQEGHAKSAIMLTMYNEPELVRSCIASGILGYVLKVDAGDELIPAIRQVLTGERYLSRRVHRRAV